jgi:hypothetical protein
LTRNHNSDAQEYHRHAAKARGSFLSGRWLWREDVPACRRGPSASYCIEYRISIMPVRLNITIDEDVHRRLKRQLPPKGISRFINDAVRARLRPGREELDKSYQAARREAWRQREADDWNATDVEDWPT